METIVKTSQLAIRFLSLLLSQASFVALVCFALTKSYQFSSEFKTKQCEQYSIIFQYPEKEQKKQFSSLVSGSIQIDRQQLYSPGQKIDIKDKHLQRKDRQPQSISGFLTLEM